MYIYECIYTIYIYENGLNEKKEGVCAGGYAPRVDPRALHPDLKPQTLSPPNLQNLKPGGCALATKDPAWEGKRARVLKTGIAPHTFRKHVFPTHYILIARKGSSDI